MGKNVRKNVGKNMEKRGQITVFVVIGLVIILTLGYFYYASNSELDIKNSKKSLLNPEPIEVKQTVQGCVEKSTDESLTLLQEGNPNNAALGLLSFYYEDNNITLPSLEDFQTEMEVQINHDLLDCLDRYNNSISGYEIKYDAPESRVLFAEQSTVVNVKFPVDILNDGQSIIYSYYDVEREIQFALLWNETHSILENIKADSDYIDLNFLLQNDYNVSFYPLDGTQIIVYTIVDPYSKLQNKNFKFTFGVDLSDDKESASFENGELK